MKTLVQKLLSTGADLSTRKALKNTLNYLGIKPENIDRLYIELKNSMFSDRIKRIDPRNKLLFLPQCLREGNCKAVLGPTGWECVKCKNRDTCKVCKIKNRAESMGYSVFVAPGGSMVFRLIKELKPKAVIGVACIKELVMAVEELNVPAQAVLLTRDGCVNTDVNLKDVFSVL